MTTNAIELLKQDHKAVRNLFDKLTDTTKRATKQRQELLEKITQELQIHTKLEEEIFYPAFRKAGGSDHEKMFFEAQEEHRAVEKLVLPDLQKTNTDHDSFGGRAKVLKELVEHHAEEEEEEMFPEAKKTLSDDELMELGARMEARKKELKKRRK